MGYDYAIYNLGAFPFKRTYTEFKRDFQEVRGVKYKESEDGSEAYVYINALGISPDDVDLSWKYGQIRDSVDFSVKGETIIEGIENPYSFEYHFTSYKPVKQVKKKFVNGLVILTLVFDKPSQPEIEILDN